MRLGRLRHLMLEQELDGMLITRPENMCYLSGRSDWEGVMIITAERQAIATDSRYYEVVGSCCPDWELIEAGYEFDNLLLESLCQRGLEGRKVGFEAAHLSVERFNLWQANVDQSLSLVACTGLVEQLRQSKDEHELRAIRRAVALSDQALDHIYGWIRPGMTEKQVAWELERFMRERGASAAAFEIIVGGGANGALPHAVPGEREILPGEPVVMDLGCVVEDYRSDVTRTICLGEPPDERYLQIWNLVLEAQLAAEEGLKAGMTGVEGDSLARSVIDSAGYGDRFGHGLGHGVGLAIHEKPGLSFRIPDPVPAGSVLTIEPGIYIPGWGGVRIEDMVVVGPDGVELLTAAAKIPIIDL